jgi:predicted O-methyltransferase YrrM
MSRIDELKNTPRVFHMKQNYPIDLRSQYGDNYSHGLVDLLNTIKLNKNTSVIVEIGGYAGVTTEIFALSVDKVFTEGSWSVDQIFSHRGDVDTAKSMFDKVVVDYKDTITVLDPAIIDEGYELTNQSIDLLYLDRVFYPNEVETILKKW